MVVEVVDIYHSANGFACTTVNRYRCLSRRKNLVRGHGTKVPRPPDLKS